MNEYHIISYIVSYCIVSCRFVSCRVLSYLISFYLILSYPILFYLILSYLILSYLILSYQTFIERLSHVVVASQKRFQSGRYMGGGEEASSYSIVNLRTSS